MRFSSSVVLSAAFLGARVLAGPANANQLAPPAYARVLDIPNIGNSTFEQLLDHDNPSLGTFSQRIWWNSQWYAGPGSPIVFFTPGEISAAAYTGYLTNATLTGQFAQAIGGAVLMVEHRYWGESSPYDELTTKNLQLLTLKQSITDFTYLAKNIVLPFDLEQTSTADKAPWVFSGGSYSGALAAWTESTEPGVFWAYHASSAPVEAIYDYWQYFAPVQQGMPKNCSTDVSLVIDYVDGILRNGTATAKYNLKKKFGLQGVVHDDDFASALENGPWLWQSNSFTTGYSGFFQFCDAIENVKPNSTIPGAEGVGLELALEGYANWVNTTMLPGYCAGYGYWTDEWDIGCFDTYNPENQFFTDKAVDNNIDRQWNWMLCNEPFGYWQDGAPADVPSIVSRLVTPEYWQRQCDLFFPTEGNYTYGAKLGKTEDQLNAYTKGWDLTNTTRLLWVNGEFDPWKTSGVSSEYRPGGPLVSTEAAPVEILPGGFHCSDLRYSNALANPGIMAVVKREIAQIKTWVDDYYY